MKSSLKLFFLLFLAAGSFTAFAASYTDGIEYFKAGQPDRAKILLERTLNDAGTNKAESYYYLGEIAFINKDYTAAAEYYRKGLEAAQAAGKIHSDIERGFIRAETINFDEMMACGGSVAAAKEKGLLRSEGKEYVVQDGDIILFRFNV